MLYTIIEASKQLSISRQAIYKKLEKMTELKTHIKIKNNVKYIDEIGFELIKTSINDNSHVNLTDTELTDKNNKIVNSADDNDNLDKLTSSHDIFYENYIKNLEDDKRKLFEEIQTKNKQIEALTDALNKSQQLNENNQILFQQNQQKVFLLEEKNQKQSSWWKRIFP